MYKVIFIDDETSVLKFLYHAIDWEKYQIEIAGAAQNGKEGLDLYDKVKPDIIVVDIEMPIVTGIEFARKVREFDKTVHIIILTAYAEFEYAKSALEFQAESYLLKPLDEDKLEECMINILRKIELREQQKNQNIYYELELCEKKLQELMIIRGNELQYKKFFSEYGEAVSSYTYVINIYLYGEQKIESQNRKEIVKKIFRKIFGDKTMVLYQSHTELFVIIESEFFATKMQKGLELLEKEDIYGFAGVAPIVKGQIWSSSYEKAKQTRYRCYYTKMRYSLEENGAIYPDYSREIWAVCEQAVTDLQKWADFEIARQEFLEGLNKINALKINPDEIYETLMELLISLKLGLTKKYGEYTAAVLRHITLDSLKQCWNYELLARYIGLLLDELKDTLDIIQIGQEPSLIIRKAKDYTVMHYGDAGLTLEQVAQYAGISKNHLSKVFSEGTGQTYWSYLTSFRIEKSKKMLRETTKSIKQISEAVGYQSINHFSRKFKELTGITPNNYRIKE